MQQELLNQGLRQGFILGEWLVRPLANKLTNDDVMSSPVGRAAYSDRTAWLMAQMSRLAYEPFKRKRPEAKDWAGRLSGISDPAAVMKLCEEFLEECAAHQIEDGGLTEQLDQYGFQLLALFLEQLFAGLHVARTEHLASLRHGACLGVVAGHERAIQSDLVPLEHRPDVGELLLAEFDLPDDARQIHPLAAEEASPQRLVPANRPFEAITGATCPDARLVVATVGPIEPKARRSGRIPS